MVTVYSPRYSGASYRFVPERRILGGEIEQFDADLFPRVEIVQEGGEFRLIAEVPGLDKEDLHIQVQDGLLTLTGEKRRESEEQLGGCRCSERYYGTFQRSFPLPTSADMERVSATLEKGVLSIRVPVSEAGETGRKIEISVH
jgi:HSP20 family protein